MPFSVVAEVPLRLWVGWKMGPGGIFFKLRIFCTGGKNLPLSRRGEWEAGALAFPLPTILHRWGGGAEGRCRRWGSSTWWFLGSVVDGFPRGVQGQKNPSKDTQLCHFVGRAERLQVKLCNKCSLFDPYSCLHHPCTAIVVDIVLWIYDWDIFWYRYIGHYDVRFVCLFVCLCVCVYSLN